MPKKQLPKVTLLLDRFIGGGQTIGTLESGMKCLVWGGLPGETVVIQPTKKKTGYIEGYVTEVLTPSKERLKPRDPESYLSTSPWQIIDFESENKYKATLIEEAFGLHRIKLPSSVEIWSDKNEFEYRNKVEFSFWYDKEAETLDLAFFRRGTKGKIVVNGTSLATPAINNVARDIVSILRQLHVDGRSMKTLLIRSNQEGKVSWQLYVKDEDFDTEALLARTLSPSVICAEVIYSNPKSPASVVTKRLAKKGSGILSDTILGTTFHYATEGFFQINIPVYQQALRDMKQWIDADKPVVDLYSGVGTIGLTIGGNNVTLVEINEHAVREMERNINELKSNAKAVKAASELALQYITNDATIIVDPPRAGLHEKVIERLREARPRRIIYLSCNPVTQARDIGLLLDSYKIIHHKGYNFFPRTPHIEHLVVLELTDN